MLKIDLHCHSEVSYDCRTPLSVMPQVLVKREINVQAVTDHNTIDGGLRLNDEVAKQNSSLRVIVGEEISTLDGELVGLFLTKTIKKGLSALKTIELIKSQGGLVLLPHGFDPLKVYRLKPRVRQELIEQIDIVEGFNPRVNLPYLNTRAVKWAEKHDKMVSAGTDAHRVADLGTAWVETEAKDVGSPQKLMTALENASIHGSWTHPSLAFAAKMTDWARQYFQKAN